MNREKELREALNRILRKVQEDGSVRLVILFGSLARGEVRETSDLDLIIVKETDKSSLTGWMSTMKSLELQLIYSFTLPKSLRP